MYSTSGTYSTLVQCSIRCPLRVVLCSLSSMAMSRDQPSSSVPPASPRPRASSAPPPLVPTLEGEPKPPVRSKSMGDLRETTARKGTI